MEGRNQPSAISGEQAMADEARGAALAVQIDGLAREFGRMTGRQINGLQVFHVAATAVLLGLLDRKQVQGVIVGVRPDNAESVQLCCDRLRRLTNQAVGAYLGRMQQVGDQAQQLTEAAAAAGITVKIAGAEPATAAIALPSPAHDGCACFGCRAQRGEARFGEVLGDSRAIVALPALTLRGLVAEHNQRQLAPQRN